MNLATFPAPKPPSLFASPAGLVALPVASTPRHFPPGLFDPHSQRQDAARRRWYESHLEAMGEPSLYERSRDGIEAYRFLWLRTFHEPLAIRLERTSDAGSRLALRRLNGAGGYHPGTLRRRLDRSLGQADWSRIHEAVTALDFWNQPASGDRQGIDGARWILEGVHDGVYHAMDRWSPEDDAPFRAVCLSLVSLAGETVREIY